MKGDDPVNRSDQSIAIRERLVNSDGRRELANDLARAYLNKANAMRALGDNRAAVTLYDQTIAILERLVTGKAHGEPAQQLGTGLSSYAEAQYGCYGK